LSKIIVAGHTCVDLIPDWNGKFEDIIPGHLIVTGRMRFSTGGVVPNTGVDLKRLGLDPILIGKIGDDLIGKITLEVIRANGDDLTDHIIIGHVCFLRKSCKWDIQVSLPSFTIILNRF